MTHCEAAAARPIFLVHQRWRAQASDMLEAPPNGALVSFDIVYIVQFKLKLSC